MVMTKEKAQNHRYLIYFEDANIVVQEFVLFDKGYKDIAVQFGSYIRPVLLTLDLNETTNAYSMSQDFHEIGKCRDRHSALNCKLITAPSHTFITDNWNWTRQN